MASWSKTKQQLQGFLSPNLEGRVEYRASSYRYAKDKAGSCYIGVEKKEIFQMIDMKYGIRWYKTEQEIAKEYENVIYVSMEEIEQFKTGQPNIPEERIPIIIRKKKSSELAREILAEQARLSKSDFFAEANTFLTTSIDASLNSSEIMPNVLAIVDRRVGKSRLKKMKHIMEQKHPIVQYFYQLRCSE